MKSTSDKTATALVALLALGAWTAASSGVSTVTTAGTSPTKMMPSEELQRPPGDKELPTSLMKSQQYEADSVIKCWQYGRLILNEPNWKMARQNLPGPVFHSDGGRYANLRVMPFGDTFCALKYGAR